MLFLLCFFFLNPPHSAHLHWFYTRRVESISHSAFFAAKSPTSMFDLLRRVHHTQSCQTLCGYEKVWRQPRGIRHGWFFSSYNLRSHFVPPPSLSFSCRTCKYHWFLFFLFLLFITELFISYPPPLPSCWWSSLILCIFVNKFLFFHKSKCKYCKGKKISLLLMFVDDLSLSFSFS